MRFKSTVKTAVMGLLATSFYDYGYTANPPASAKPPLKLDASGLCLIPAQKVKSLGRRAEHCHDNEMKVSLVKSHTQPVPLTYALINPEFAEQGVKSGQFLSATTMCVHNNLIDA